jgi:hypothetical protein
MPGPKKETQSVTAIPRRRYAGSRISSEVIEKGPHFIRCSGCGCWVDMRDLAQLHKHRGVLLHSLHNEPR